MNDQQREISQTAIRKAHGYFETQAHFAMASGISAPTLSRLINCQRDPTAVEAQLIERATRGKVRREEVRPDLFKPRARRQEHPFDDAPVGRMRTTEGRRTLIAGERFAVGVPKVSETSAERAPATIPLPAEKKQNGKARSRSAAGKAENGKAESRKGKEGGEVGGGRA